MTDSPAVRKLIVVGLDHTPAGSAALLWAVDEGVRCNARVMAVHVYDRSRADLAHGADHEAAKTRERIEAHRQLVDVLGDRAPRLGTAISQLDGPVARRLVEAAGGASLLIVGRPTDPDHRSLLAELAAGVSCPVVVVNEGGDAVPIQQLLLELAT